MRNVKRLLQNHPQNTVSRHLSACVHAPAGAPLPAPGNQPVTRRAETRDAWFLHEPRMTQDKLTVVGKDRATILEIR